MADTDQTNFTTLTVDLLSAYFSNNSVDSDALPDLIRSTHEALKQIDTGTPETSAAPEYTPAVSVRRSTASRDFIISLVDGKKYQTLKRHLTRHNLTPAAYRDRYGLPRDYPMVAPSFSEARCQVAAKIGLGRKATTTTGPALVEVTAPAEAPAPVGKVFQPKPAVATSTTKGAVKKAAPAKPKAATPPAAPLSETAPIAAAPAGADAPTPTKAAATKPAPAEAPADKPKPTKATSAKATATAKPAEKVAAKRRPRAAKALAPGADTAKS